MTKVLNSFFFLIMALVLCTSCESRRTIVNALDEREANEILVFLATRGIEGQKVVAVAEGGGGQKGLFWNISVESSRATEAMALLNQAGLPRKRSKSLIETLGSSGLVPSPLEQKARYQVGIAESIANTIRKIDGVLDAEVRISFPEEDPLNPNAPKQKITPSVFVKHNGVLDDPNSHLQTRIRKLVASSVNGLDYDNVTVVGDRAKYGDLASSFQTNIGESEQKLMHVWSIIIAKDSLTRFRIIFFSFILSLLLLTLMLTWFLWKFLPVIKETKKIKQLFTFHQIQLTDLMGSTSTVEQSRKKDEDESDESDSDSDET